MQRVYRAARPTTRTQLPSLPKFPDIEVAKESIIELSKVREQRGQQGKFAERRKPFEEILAMATEGMLSSVRQTMPS